MRARLRARGADCLDLVCVLVCVLQSDAPGAKQLTLFYSQDLMFSSLKVKLLGAVLSRFVCCPRCCTRCITAASVPACCCVGCICWLLGLALFLQADLPNYAADLPVECFATLAVDFGSPGPVVRNAGAVFVWVSDDCWRFMCCCRSSLWGPGMTASQRTTPRQSPGACWTQCSQRAQCWHRLCRCRSRATLILNPPRRRRLCCRSSTVRI